MFPIRWLLVAISITVCLESWKPSSLQSGGSIFLLARAASAHTHSCTIAAPRNDTPPYPIIRNVSMDGTETTNKTLILKWNPSYVRSRDVSFPCSATSLTHSPNPFNLFTLTMAWPSINCNNPNVTNGSVVFYNFSVKTIAPVPTTLNYYMDLNITRIGTEASSLLALGLGPLNTSAPFTFLWPFPLIITSNATENATMNMAIWTPYGYIYPPNIFFNVTTYFECDVYHFYLTTGNSGSQSSASDGPQTKTVSSSTALAVCCALLGAATIIFWAMDCLNRHKYASKVYADVEEEEVVAATILPSTLDINCVASGGGGPAKIEEITQNEALRLSPVHTDDAAIRLSPLRTDDAIL